MLFDFLGALAHTEDSFRSANGSLLERLLGGAANRAFPLSRIEYIDS